MQLNKENGMFHASTVLTRVKLISTRHVIVGCVFK